MSCGKGTSAWHSEATIHPKNSATRAALDIADGPDVVLAWVAGVIEDLLGRAKRPASDLIVIGIGLPGPVEHSTGRPTNPPIMPGWDRYDVPAHMQRTFPVPVLIDNDVNIMALGEQRTHLPEVPDLIFLKVATGIGAGIISGDQLQRGAQGTSGDLGHVRVARADGVLCRCGNEGCLEAISAGPALAAALQALNVEASTTQEVVDLVRQGDQATLQVVRQAARHIGEVVATTVNLLNPSVVVIGGRLADAGEHLLAGIREVVYQRSLPLATQVLRVVAFRGEAHAGVLGAASLAIDHALSPEAIRQRARGGLMRSQLRFRISSAVRASSSSVQWMPEPTAPSWKGEASPVRNYTLTRG